VPVDPQSESAWLREQLSREKRARALLQSVGVAANEAATVDEVLQVALDQICASTGWPVGHVYLPSNETTLTPTSIWHFDDPEKFNLLRTVTESTPLMKGVGLPGRVMANSEPEWIINIYRDDNFPRINVASDLGVRAGFAFPVLAGKQLLAVLEFFSERPEEPDQQLLEVMANIGATLALIISQKFAENALRESEMRFRSITHSANDAIITANSQGVMISWNMGAEKIFGYKAEEVISQPLTRLIPERFREAHRIGLERVSHTGESRVIGKTVELAGLRSDGTEFPLELSLASWRMGQNVFYSGIIRDISERKLAEQKLREFTEELERRVQEGIDALREAERLAAYGNMVACVAHEIRHPIFALQAAAYVLKDSIKTEKNFAPQFAILERETARMTRLMDDLLEFAKPPSLMLSHIDPASLLQEAKEAFLTHSNEIKVDVAATSGLPKVVMDRERILQVLLNLMINARKHVTGLTKIRISAQIAVESRNGTADILFRVENDGAGISGEQLPRIFEPFFTTGKGAGLGLAIVKRIISQHHGSIHVESNVENGTIFSFALPVIGPQI
jgi:PAS domain S-box-containing protein